MVTFFRRGLYTDASNRAASALLLGTHRSLGASSPVLELMERGPEYLAVIASFALEPRFALAVSGSADATLRLWDLREGRCTATLEGYGGEVTAVAADFESMQALSGSWDRTLRLWDIREGRYTATLEGHLRNIVCRLTVEELHCWRARAAKLLAQEVFLIRETFVYKRQPVLINHHKQLEHAWNCL
mgnify:CR=1 FL=1